MRLFHIRAKIEFMDSKRPGSARLGSAVTKISAVSALSAWSDRKSTSPSQSPSLSPKYLSPLKVVGLGIEVDDRNRIGSPHDDVLRSMMFQK